MQRPDHFIAEFGYFDSATAANPVVVGEYAIIQNNTGNDAEPVNWNRPRVDYPFWMGTVGEAVFLLGAERNSDRVMGTVYAPLLQNLNSYQWTVG